MTNYLRARAKIRRQWQRDPASAAEIRRALIQRELGHSHGREWIQAQLDSPHRAIQIAEWNDGHGSRGKRVRPAECDH